MRHVDEGRLQAWLDGPRAGLAEDERTAVEAHLAGCPSCAARLEALRGEGERARALLGAAGAGGDDGVPAFDAVVARARGLDAGRGRPRWHVAAGWAASVLVALGVGWLAKGADRGPVGGAAPPRPVAEAADFPAAPPVVARAPDDPGRSEAGAGDGAGAAVAEKALERTARGTVPEAVVADAAAAPLARKEAPIPPLAAAPTRERVALRGRVTDGASGRPLASAQVHVPGSGIGAFTDEDGRYLLSLEVPPAAGDSATLVVELLGYGSARRVVALGGGDTVSSDVRMSARALALDELVVTGAPAPGGEGPIRPPDDARGWRPASMPEAEAFAGFPARRVPDLPVVEVAVGSFDATPVVRVTQRLEGGGRLTLLQAPRPVAFPDAWVEGRAELRLAPDVFVAGRGPLPADSIRALLGRLR